jgi:hypothetical protein
MSTLKSSGRRPTISTSRYEVILDQKPWEQITLGELRSVLPDLRALGHHMGFVIGHAYARAAGSFLAKLERIEDTSAERNYRQRSKSKS